MQPLHLAPIDGLEAALRTVEARRGETLAPFGPPPSSASSPCRASARRWARVIVVAEVGLDMTRFPTAGHLVSWAGSLPTLGRERQRPSTRTRPAPSGSRPRSSTRPGPRCAPNRPTCARSSCVSRTVAGRRRPSSPSPPRCSPRAITSSSTGRVPRPRSRSRCRCDMAKLARHLYPPKSRFLTLTDDPDSPGVGSRLRETRAAKLRRQQEQYRGLPRERAERL